jgi:putative FmdB family regulatory protein
MPVYTYRCENCSHQFDKHQNFSEEALKACPVCRKHALHKVYSAAGVVFKGSGFYITDARKKSSSAPSAKKKSSNNKPKKEKTERKKTESKAANKKEAA